MKNKIVIVGDLHLGKKNSIDQFVQYQLDEIDKVIEYILENENEINTIIVLGDVFDNRKSINIKTLNDTFSKIKRIDDIDVYLIVGNHDCFYKNDIKLNSLNTIFDHHELSHLFTIVNKPLEIPEIDSLLVPWMAMDNYNECLLAIKNSKAKYCFGHFELNGFQMNSNTICKSELKAGTFKHFDEVYSGHFHTKSQQGNITYLGSHCQLDWSDFGEKKGFYELNLEDDLLYFIESKDQIFRKIIINDDTDIKKIEKIENSFLKIYLNRKLTPRENNGILDLISNNISYEIIDNTVLNDFQSDDVVKNEDFKDVVESCVDSQEMLDDDKQRVIEFILESHHEMMNES